MSDPVRPHPWDSPGKNTGVGCHFLLQCIIVKSESEVAQSCLTLRDPMDCNLPGSSVYRIFQARVLEWGAIALSGFVLKAFINKNNKKIKFSSLFILNKYCWWILYFIFLLSLYHFFVRILVFNQAIQSQVIYPGVVLWHSFIF